MKKIQGRRVPQDWNRNRGLYFKVGLVLSMGLVFMAFEWRFYSDFNSIDLISEDDSDAFVLMDPIPPLSTEVPPAPEPKVLDQIVLDEKAPKPDLILEEPKPLVEHPRINRLPEVQALPREEPILEPLIPEDTTEYTIVEINPEPQGGYKAFYKYLRKNLRYPAKARRMSIGGKVFVQFTIEKSGKMDNFKIVKSLGFGLDEEVIRVLRAAPAWNPGQQGGRKVRVRMTLPVSFHIK